MSTSYIAINPVNPLLPNPPRKILIDGLKDKGFLDAKDHKWINPKTNTITYYYKIGYHFIKFWNFIDCPKDYISKVLSRTIIEYREYEKIKIEVYAPGKFLVKNPVTGRVLDDTEWSKELGKFLEDNEHKWTDPLNNEQYYFFDLEYTDMALGKHFLIIEECWGEPKTLLLDLLENITNQKYEWIWTKV